MRDDLRTAFRSLRSSKTFTAVALSVLALGIGASTAIFSVVDAVVLRGLPFDEHDRLVAVGQRSTPNTRIGPSTDPESVSSFAPQNYTDLAAQQQVFASIAAIAGAAVTLREPGAEPEEVRAQRVTAGFFSVLREPPALGRAFTSENETDGQNQVAVLSDGLWRRRFGADPDIVGKTIPLEGGAYQVVGVMRPSFEYPIGSSRPTELWVPYVVPASERIRDPSRMSIYLQGIARLKPGVSVAKAQANLDQIAQSLLQANPQWNKGTLLGVRPLHDHIVVGAALFLGSFRVLMHIDPGFNPDHVLTASIQPRVDQRVANAQPPNYSAEFGQIVERIAATSGVSHASVISGGMPMGGSMSSSTINIPGRTLPPGDSTISIRRVTPDYHLAMGIPLTRGRLFTDGDRAGSTPVVIINESAAKKYFPGEDPLGKPIAINGNEAIVGVVGDVYQTSLETSPRTEAYVPVAQGTTTSSELVVRTSGDPYAVLPAVRAAVLAVLPDVPLRNVRTMEEIISRQTAQRRFNMLLLGLFGVLGLIISAVGIYGVMAYVVSQREREIGVRMALGATRGSVIGMILRSASVLVLAGLVIGGIAAWSLGGSAKTFLFRMDTNDPRVFAAAIGALVAAALVASVIPARRAAGLDLLIALRSE